jgi:hypothetical protein
MTALAIAGLGGSAAACLVMAKLVKQLPGSGEAQARIADSWAAFPGACAHERRLPKLRA